MKGKILSTAVAVFRDERVNKPLHQAPARLQRFLLQLQKYDLQVIYKPGKYLYIADTLS